MRDSAVEIEVDGGHNEALYFRPLQRSIRGRFDLNRVGEPMAKVKASDWPLPVPSQRLGIDPDGNGFLREPLHDDEFAPLREKIEKEGQRLESAVQEFESIDLPTWLYWMKKAVESGIARVVSGKLPEKIEGQIRKNFIHHEEPPASDRLTAALERQSVAFEQLTAAILKLTTEK